MSTVFRIDAEHPWPGLMPFTEDAQAWFHGREQEAEELLRLIRRETLTVLFGQSGLGKSSLLNAGLFPRLRAEDFLPVYVRLDVAANAAPFREQILGALERACVEHRVEAPQVDRAAPLWALFHRRDADFWSPRNRLLTPVLVIDQFEEIFTLGRHAEELEQRCRDLLEELADLIEHRMPADVARAVEARPELAALYEHARAGCKVVLSFREDYLPDFEALRALSRSIMQNRMRLTRMSGAQAFSAIVRAGGHLMPDDVAAQVVRFVAAPRAGRREDDLGRLEVEPALMSVVCHELNNQRLRAGRRAIGAEQLQGGAQQRIIEDFYTTSLRDLPAAVQTFVEDRLLTAAGFRDSCAVDDALQFPGVERAAIDTLIARRLLRVEERSGVLRVELTHDVLTGVARASRDMRKQRLEAQARQEAESKRRAQSRRLRLLFGAGLGSAIALAAVFAVLLDRANDERRRLVETQSNVWLARANAAADAGAAGEPLAMIAQALRLRPDNRAALARAVAFFRQRNHPVQLAQVGLGGRARVAALPDGRFVLYAPGATAVLASDTIERAQVVDVHAAPDDYADYGLLAAAPGAARDVAAIRFGSDVDPAAAVRSPADWPVPPPTFDADARAIVYVSRALKIHVLDAAGGARIGVPIRLPAVPTQIVVSPGRTWLAALLADGATLLARLDGTQRRRVAPVDVGPRATLVAPTDTGRVALIGERGAALLDASGRAALRPVDGTAVGPVAASPDGRWFALSVGDDVALVDADDGNAAPRRFPGTAPARDVAFGPDGALLAVASLDAPVRVWSVLADERSGQSLAHPTGVLRLRFSADGRVLATGSADGSVRLWDPASGALLTQPLPHPDPVADVALDAGGHAVRVVTFGDELFAWRWDDAAARPVPAGAVVAATADGRQLAFAPPHGEPAHAPADGSAQPSAIPDAKRAPEAIAWSSDGRLLAAALAAGGATVIAPDAAEHAPLWRDADVRAVRLSPGGSRLALVDAARIVRLADAREGRETGRTLPHAGPVVAVDFAADERTILTAERGALHVWDAVDGREIRAVPLPDARISFAAFGPDPDSVLAVVEGRVLRLDWTRARSSESAPPIDAELLLGDLRVWSAALSPSRQLLALGGVDGRLRVVDVDALHFVGETMQHDDVVLGADFASDARLVSWSRDGRVRVWDARSGYAIGDAVDAGAEPLYARLLADGDLVVGTAAGTSVRQAIGTAPVARAPEWLPDLLEAVGGSRVDAQGGIVRVRDRLQRLRAFATSPAVTGDAEWNASLQSLVAAPRARAGATSPAEPLQR